MKYKCLYCEKEETFESPDAAFMAGWDILPKFTVGPLCDECPTVEYLKYLEREADREF